MEDDLRIPLSYLMSNTMLHSTFVKILNYVSRSRTINTGFIGKTIREFAEHNKYTEEAFYQSAQWSFNTRNNNENVQRNDL